MRIECDLRMTGFFTYLSYAAMSCVNLCHCCAVIVLVLPARSDLQPFE